MLDQMQVSTTISSLSALLAHPHFRQGLADGRETFLPKYKHKTEGRNILVYTIQAISRGKKGLQCGIIKPSMLAIEIQTKQKNVNQVRIVPRKGFYVVEVVYEQEVQ